MRGGVFGVRRVPVLARPTAARTGAGVGVGRERSAGLSVEHIHLVLVEAFGATELEPFLARSKVQVLFGVADMFAPVTHLRHRGERSHAAVDLEHQSGRVLSVGWLWGALTLEVFISGLVAFEVGSSAGSEALLTAETLQLRAHTQGVPLHSLLLTPHAHDLHTLHVLHCRGLDEGHDDGGTLQFFRGAQSGAAGGRR